VLGGPVNTLSTIVYHSKAAVQFAELDLLYLLAGSRARNRAEGITGVLVFDRDTFFQWIEGPNLPLQRVWNSIRKDPRHQDIQVLADLSIPTRVFHDWHMQFAHRDCKAAQHIEGLIQASDDVMDRLHDRPEQAPLILAEFSELGSGPFARILSAS
jgi:hypothetical protein